jgi:hypothetical protein
MKINTRPNVTSIWFSCCAISVAARSRLAEERRSVLNDANMAVQDQ